MSNWLGRNVVILGAARQGTALARYLALQGASVVVSDLRGPEKLQEAINALAGLPVTWVLGSHPLNLLDHADLVCPSGGVPLDQPVILEALRRGIALSNDSQVFMEAAPCKVIGITGSAGKTTTTTLVGRMAQVALSAESGFPTTPVRRAWVGGNIGSPLITFLDDMQPHDLAVVEFSSFQLEIMQRSPQVAAVLNITPNHLDRHKTMEAYTAAKARILQFQSLDDAVVLGRDDPGAWGLAGMVRSQLWTFGMQDATDQGTMMRSGEIFLCHDGRETWLMPALAIRLRGQHNQQNVLAACAIGAAAGFPPEALWRGVEGFTGVAHRLEFVRSWGGASWYNDSIATAPERTMAAIRSFDEPLVVLAGGRDKDLPWQEFAQLARSRLDHLILFGEAAAVIGRAIGSDFPYISCQNLEEAVQAAARIVKPGDVVLLSPGGTSYDEFRDFEERGECFKRLVMNL